MDGRQPPPHYKQVSIVKYSVHAHTRMKRFRFLMCTYVSSKHCVSWKYPPYGTGGNGIMCPLSCLHMCTLFCYQVMVSARDANKRWRTPVSCSDIGAHASGVTCPRSMWAIPPRFYATNATCACGSRRDLTHAHCMSASAYQVQLYLNWSV